MSNGLLKAAIAGDVAGLFFPMLGELEIRVRSQCQPQSGVEDGSRKLH